jgi:hypothetical protein
MRHRWARLTTLQLHLFNGLFLAVTIAVSVITRATPRRIAGAFVGSAGIGPLGLGVIVFCERAGWWHMVIRWEPFYLMLLWLDAALCAYVFLITWRIARRFGGRGLAIVVVVAAIIGPFRDSWYMAKFPEWGYYAPGYAPMLAISCAYAVMIIVGHGLMRLVAGPAEDDPLARRPWERAGV